MDYLIIVTFITYFITCFTHLQPSVVFSLYLKGLNQSETAAKKQRSTLKIK